MLTVLMSCYNSQAYLDEAIQSVLQQTHRDFEFLIVNDGSADDSLQICRKYEKIDNRIRVITHENWGASISLNHGVSCARGEWIFRMDPDDVMMPNRIERQLAFLQENPDLAVASALVYLIDKKGRLVGKSRSPYTTRKVMRETTNSPHLIGFNHPASAIKKSVFESVGGYRQKFWPAEDLDLWNRISEQGHMMLVQTEFLLKYRLHSASITISSGKWQVQTIDWVEDSKMRRRAGIAEQTFAEFLAARRALPWLQRLNTGRYTVARTLYKAAVHQWATRDYLRCFPKMALAMLLEPQVFISRLWPRIIGLAGRLFPASTIPPAESTPASSRKISGDGGTIRGKAA